MYQLFAKLLERDPSGTLPNHYQTLVPPLMLGATWDTKGNVPALNRLLCAIIPRAAQSIVGENQVQPILGIFQGLLNAKKTEPEAFDLLEAILLSIPKYVFLFFVSCRL